MTILHINNRFIVPLKCDSRFLRKNNWKTLEYVFNYVKNKYRNELDIMLEMVNNDEIYYNKFDFLKFEKKIL
jgi:hypothetical protein